MFTEGIKKVCQSPPIQFLTPLPLLPSHLPLLSSYRSLINSSPSPSLSFSVLLTTSTVSCAVHFRPASDSDTATTELYDPVVDSTSSFLSIRGLQLHILACFTRGGMGVNNSPQGKTERREESPTVNNNAHANFALPSLPPQCQWPPPPPPSLQPTRSPLLHPQCPR